MEDELEPSDIRHWIAVAIIDRWGQEWREICIANGAKFKDDRKAGFGTLENAWQQR